VANVQQIEGPCRQRGPAAVLPQLPDNQTHAVQRALERREPQFPYNLCRDKLPDPGRGFQDAMAEFIAALGGAMAWPHRAQAQQPEHLVRVGFLTGLPQNPCNEARLSAFRQTLAERGWAEGRNLRIDYRFAGGDPDLLRKYAAELVGSQPNVVMAVGSGAVASLRQSSRAVPIIFAQVIDPVGGGFVEGLAQPAAMPPDFCCTSTATLTYLEAIVPLAARFRLPAAYSDRDFVAGGGLLSYGPDIIDQYRRAADYVDRSAR
jgi:hypothetical protein